MKMMVYVCCYSYLGPYIKKERKKLSEENQKIYTNEKRTLKHLKNGQTWVEEVQKYKD